MADRPKITHLVCREPTDAEPVAGELVAHVVDPNAGCLPDATMRPRRTAKALDILRWLTHQQLEPWRVRGFGDPLAIHRQILLMEAAGPESSEAFNDDWREQAMPRLTGSWWTRVGEWLAPPGGGALRRRLLGEPPDPQEPPQPKTAQDSRQEP